MAGTGNDKRDTKRTDGPKIPGWADRTPTGFRDGINREEAEALARRQRQTQRVNRQDKFVRKFDHTQFVAHISDRMSFNRNGDMSITILVPFQFKHLAEPLSDAFGIPLSFDVEVWKPYQDSQE